MKSWTKTEWRWYRNHLQMLSCYYDHGDSIYKGLQRRIAWINENRL